MARAARMRARFRRGAVAVLRVAIFPVILLLRLTREGWALLVPIVLCAFLSARAGNVPLLASMALAALMLLAALLGWLGIRKIALRRIAPERIFAGDKLRVLLVVDNRSRLPAGAIRLEESLTEGAGRRGLAFAVAVLGRGSERTRYEVRVRKRGVYRYRPTLLRTTFPFGLFTMDESRSVGGRVTVYPRLGEIDRELFQEMEQALTRMVFTRPSRDERDFRGLREYRNGDNPKWIHWRSSARLGKPLVREFEEPETRRVVVCLDTCTQRLGPRREAYLEMAVSFTATLARDCIRMGHEVDVVAFMPKLMQMRLSLERRNIETLLENLANLKPAPDRNLTGLMDAMDRSVLARAYVVLVGLGSFRLGLDLSRYKTPDNEIRTIEVGSEEFRKLFHRVSREDREGLDEDLLPEDAMELADEEATLQLVE